MQNDIALLQLKYPLDFGFMPHVGSICLPPSSEPIYSDCLVTGWGQQLSTTEVIIQIFILFMCNLNHNLKYRTLLGQRRYGNVQPNIETNESNPGDCSILREVASSIPRSILSVTQERICLCVRQGRQGFLFWWWWRRYCLSGLLTGILQGK